MIIRSRHNAIRFLRRSAARAAQPESVKDRIAGEGATVRFGTPEALDKLVRDEIVTRMKVWKAAGVKVE